jgi:predicted dehydrogenase
VVAPTFASTEGCEVAGVVSARDDVAVEELCRRCDVDVVSVHSPPFLHRRHVGRALTAGRAVLCDKPFGLNTGEAESMLAEAESAGVVHLVNFEFRCDPARVQMRDWIRQGAVGPVEHVNWTHLSSGSRVPLRAFGWLFQRSAGGGWIGAWASHAVDTLRFLLDAEITGATALLSTTIRERPDHDGILRSCDAEDGLSASLGTSAGATVAIDSGFAAPVSLPPRLVAMGPTGAIENVADMRLVLRAVDGTREERSFGERDGDRHAGPMTRWAEVVRDAVRDGVAPPDAPTFADGLACARVLDALRAGPHSTATAQLGRFSGHTPDNRPN